MLNFVAMQQFTYSSSGNCFFNKPSCQTKPENNYKLNKEMHYTLLTAESVFKKII